MQNRLLFFFLFTLTPFLLDAQVFVGFKAGINQSKTRLMFNIKPTDLVRRSDFLGLSVGIPIEVKMTELVQLQPELLFVTEGSLVTVSRPEENRIYNNVLHYLKFPLLTKVTLMKREAYQINGLVGIIPAYAIGIRSFSFTQNFSAVRQEPISFQSEAINRFDFSVSAGGSLEKTIAKGIKMALEARYHLGLHDIDKNAENTSFTEGLQLTLGLWMPIKKRKEIPSTLAKE